MSEQPSRSIDRLLSRYVDGEISDAELAQLDRAIREEASGARRAAHWFFLHRQTLELAAEHRFSTVVDGVLAGSLSPPGTRSDALRRPGAPATRSGRRRRRTWSVFAVATAAASLVAVSALLSTEDRVAQSPSGSGAHSNGARTNIVAAVTSMSDAVLDAASGLSVGDSLREGDRIELESGIVKLTYNCGAELLLEGPCRFIVVDAMQGKLCRGKLTADVPPRAFGFGVVCPNTDIIDLGTSFGVAVNEAGETDLQVFEGEVMCAASDFDAQQSPAYQHVVADRAIRFRERSRPGEEVAATDDRFVTLRRHRSLSTAEDGSLGGSGLTLWLHARYGVELDEKGRVAAWSDRLTRVNRAGEDAVQSDPTARPRWIESGVGGGPAVRFDGTSDFLVTTPLATTDEQTVALVLAYGDRAYGDGRQWGSQVLNYDGPPSREAAGVVMPGVIQIGESLREREFAPGRPNALAFAGFVGATSVESGRVDAPQALRPGEPAVLIYRYSHAEQSAELWLNGREVAATRAVAPVAIVSRKIIGRHAWKDLHFAGDLAELRIYNEALGAEQIERLCRDLGREHRVAPLGEGPG